MPPGVSDKHYAYLDALRKQKKALAAKDAALMKSMATEFYKVQAKLADKLELAIRTVQDLQDAGQPVNIGKLYQVEHYKRLMKQVDDEFQQYAAYADTHISNAMQAYGHQAAADAVGTLNSVSPSTGISFDQLAKQEVSQMVMALQNAQPLDELLDMRAVTEASKLGVANRMIQGVAMGQSPKEIARACQNLLSAGLQKAMVIARTETMRTYRTVQARVWDKSGIVAYQRRLAAKGSLTCAGCLASDGTLYPASIPIPDHPNGMCTGVPVLKGEEHLPPPWETGDEWLAKQPEDVQKRILGPSRLSQYKAGTPLQSFAKETYHPTWGGSVVVQPLKAGPGGISTVKQVGSGPGPKPLSASAPSTPPVAPAGPAPAAPPKAPTPPPKPAAPQPAGVKSESMDGWVRTGPQAGSNPGGWFQAPDGSEWYAKQYANPMQARVEAASRQLYSKMGVVTPETKLLTDAQGNLWVAGKRLENSSLIKLSDKPAYAKSMIGPNSVLGDRDWSKSDNFLRVGADWRVQKPAAMDTGGTMMFRARGEFKAFTADNWVDDLQGLLSHDDAKLWAKMDSKDWQNATKRLQGLKDYDVRRIIRDSGLDDDLADIIIKRRDALIDDFTRRQSVQWTPLKGDFKYAGPSKYSARDWMQQKFGGWRIDHLERVYGGTTAQFYEAEYALRDYKVSGYSAMNSYLRKKLGKTTGASQHLSDSFRAIDDAMKRTELPEDMILQRVWTSDKVGNLGKLDFYHLKNNPNDLQKLVGSDVTEYGYGSTSFAGDWHRHWSGNICSTIKAPKGTRGVPIDQSSGLEEAEWLMPHNTKYKIVGAEYKDGKIWLHLELMEQDF